MSHPMVKPTCMGLISQHPTIYVIYFQVWSKLMEVRGECPPARSIQKIRLIEIFEVQRSIQIFKGVSVKQPARLVHIDLIQPWASGLLKSSLKVIGELREIERTS